jgi:hypothetical protein
MNNDRRTVVDGPIDINMRDPSLDLIDVDVQINSPTDESSGVNRLNPRVFAEKIVLEKRMHPDRKGQIKSDHDVETTLNDDNECVIVENGVGEEEAKRVDEIANELERRESLANEIRTVDEHNVDIRETALTRMKAALSGKRVG